MESFAIVGVSMRMPQEAVDEDSFWRVLETKRNLMTPWPKDRANLEAFYEGISENKHNKLHARGAHFIDEDPGVFDASFFSILPREAAAIDPQQRWALEAAYHAVENAGIRMEDLKGSLTAVYASSFTNDYLHMSTKDPDAAPPQTVMGTAPSILSNRISWFFDIHGPSVFIDTACSSSLVALDMACQAMRNGDATSALVIGSNLLLSPELSTYLDRLGFLSPDSRCYSFDSRANGYARGEGVIALVIKPLSAALKNGDVVRAVIRATGTNQDGRTPGLTQPSIEAQERLIRHVYAKSGLSFDETLYCEAHGTGTAVGDPIEMEAIARVFNSSRSSGDPLYVGSVKPNIGHLEATSGLAGVVKSVLMLEKGLIPPNALFENLNPEIEAKGHHIPEKCIAWPRSGLRRISVNSFGFGGTNSHVILDDAFHHLSTHRLRGHHTTAAFPNEIDGDKNRTGANENELESKENSVELDTKPRPMLLVFSGANAAAVQRIVHSYNAYYANRVLGVDGKLESLAYTLAARRSIMPWSTFAVTGPCPGAREDDAHDGLGVASSLRTETPIHTAAGMPAAAFVFTGQGVQYVGMGRELMRYPIFAQSLRRSDDIMAILGSQRPLLDDLMSEDRIHSPEVSQPLCTALQMALVELLRSFGVHPVAVIGHSSGEIAAAYTTGALSHEAACKVAYFRGQVAGNLRRASSTNPGAMMSVNLDQLQVPPLLQKLGIEENSVHVACMNSPTNITLSGPGDAIDTLKQHLDDQGIFAQRIAIGVAYHSPAMRSVSEDYLRLMGSLETGVAPSYPIPMVSTVTGHIAPPETLARARYWVDNLLSPVRFVEAIRDIQDSISAVPDVGGPRIITDLVEIGPHSALKRAVKDSVPSLRYHTALNRNTPASKAILELVGSLFCHGYPVSVVAANGQDHNSSPPLVDCPPYPFDHSRSYWIESRLSKDYRLRKFTPGYLIGKRVYDWNPLVPRWRNWMCTETIPWLGDHIVNGTVLCPGTGMLVMAIEAARQAAEPRAGQLSGFLFEDAQFLAPIVAEETMDKAPETIVELRPVTKSADEKMPTWSDVRIFSHTRADNKWKECFRTRIQVQYQDTSHAKFSGRDETSMENERLRGLFEDAINSCSRTIDSSSFYRFMSRYGFGYGPSFQLLRNICWDGGQTSCARIDMLSAARFHPEADSPVHPAILDAAVHLVLTQASKGLREDTPTLVPKRLAKGWISSRIWGQSTTSVRLRSVEHAGEHLVSGMDGSIYGLADDGSLLCSMEHLQVAEVSTVTGTTKNESDRMLLHKIDWQPCLSLLNPEALQRLFSDRVRSDNTTVTPFLPELEMALGMVARKALMGLQEADLARAPPYMRKYVAAMERQFVRNSAGESPELSDSELTRFLQDFEAEQPLWRLFPMVARALPSILRGETDPLELLFGTKAVQEFYAHVFRRYHKDGLFNTFLNLASHENPGLRILEVGAGTGAMSSLVIDALRSFETATGQIRFSQYFYTDVSAVFFENARSMFGDAQNRMHFKVLDLNVDPLSQGFEPESFDIIVAGSVLHVCADLTDALKRVRSLLKPGGLLISLEIVKPESVCISIGFGLVEGWWSAKEDWRIYSPLITQARWDTLLHQSGFSGVDIALEDSEDEISHLSSIMISRAVGKAEVPYDHKVPQIILLVDRESTAQCHLAEKIKERYNHAQFLDLADLDNTQLHPSALVVSLLEVEKAFLAGLSAATFSQVRTHLADVQDLLWVTSSSHSDYCDPHLGLARGFLRTIRTEYDNKHIVTLAIESCSPGTEDSFVAQIIRACFEADPPSRELEFVVSDDVLTIGRLAQNRALDEKRLAQTQPSMVRRDWGHGAPLKLEVGTPGMLDTLRFVEDPESDLAAHEVEIQQVVCPISFRDVFIALGKLGKEPLGFECAGTVTRVGTIASETLCPGDRVVMISPGCMRSHPRAPADAVFKIPDDLTFENAVAGINPGATAYQGLVNIARLQAGEKVLIHAAAGSTGQMAVKLAQSIGAEVFATVGTEEKRKLITDPRGLGIPESHVFYSRDISFKTGLMRVTSGYGVDVVLNSLSGEGLLASFDCLAPYGRFVDIGKSDMMANSALPMAGFAKNISFSSVDLYHIAIDNSKLTRSLVEKVLAMVSDRNVGPPAPLHIYPVSRVEQALRYMQCGKNTGRILVTFEKDNVVSAHVVQRSIWRFETDATYVVVGGLGGLGRAIVCWMVDKGARNFILPSRSGPSSRAALELISEVTRKGGRVVAPRCDVASADEFKALLDDCVHLPPIKGCINSAVDLQDSVFENMTYTQWSRGLGSKVDTSWNLHNLLPKDMDFFILLSSLAGIYGSASQANYAAGNTFQDSLARMRTASGFKRSVALDLGWMVDIGMLTESENEHLRRHRDNTQDMAPVRSTDLFALLDHFCDPALPQWTTLDGSQLLVGTVTPADFRARGAQPLPWLSQPLFAGFDVVLPDAAGSARKNPGAMKQDHAHMFRQAEKSEKLAVVAEAMRYKMARTLSVEPSDIDPERSLAAYGIDSLMAVELRNWLGKDFGANLTVFEIMGATKVDDVAELVVERVQVGK